MRSSVGAALLFASTVSAVYNGGVGKLPSMGYDTYNAFAADFDQELTIGQAKLMKKLGLVDAGYNTFILDDFYVLRDRDEHGNMQENRTRFPGGMKHWTKQINKLGISASAYSSNGYKTCGGYPASYGRELQDLETWRSWGWNYMVKYDNCYIPEDNITQENEYGRYARMRDAINQLAEKYNETPLIYSICQWGWQDPFNWAWRLGQAWRIDNDLKPYWPNIATVLWEQSRSYLSTNFYQHGDMDILEVGNSNGRGSPPGTLTLAEERTHFTAWAFSKSHLLIGTDLRGIPQGSLDILLNKEIIAINQDPGEGAAIAPFRTGYPSAQQIITYSPTNPPPYWAGNSSYGPIFMIINTQNTTQTMSFDLTENWAVRAGRQYRVRDMWAHADVGIATRNWTVTLGAHDVAALLMTDIGREPVFYPLCAEPLLVRQCTAPNGSYVVEPGTPQYGF